MPRKPPKVPKIRVRTLSSGENRSLNVAVGTFVRAAAKKDWKKLYNPPTLRLTGCSAAYNKAFNQAYRDEVTAAVEAVGVVPMGIIAATIIANIVGNIAGNIISQKIG